MQDTLPMFCHSSPLWFFQLPHILYSTNTTDAFAENLCNAVQYPAKSKCRCGKAPTKSGHGKCLIWRVFAVAAFALSGTGIFRLPVTMNQKPYTETEKLSISAIEIIRGRLIFKFMFQLDKFRFGGVTENIFNFFKKNPKVFKFAADSLNKGNCNRSDLR
jgi:hypothetical protein